jgi:hypothetical protein
VKPLLLSGPASPVVVHEVDLAAYDGLNSLPAAGGIQLHGAVHHAVIGEREGRLAEGRRSLGQLLDLARSVQQ